MPTLEDLREVRLQKVKKLKEMGINPYPASCQKDVVQVQITTNFDEYNNRELSITGRLMSFREHGNLVFADLSDESGSIQLFIKKDTLLPTDSNAQILGFSDLNLFDIGDFVQAQGIVTKTTAGEISLLVKTLKMLTKSIRPLPDKHEGMKDPELIFRKRYLDLVMTPKRRDVFKRKAKFWQVQRQFLNQHGFIEVETPVLEHVTGGADARPFVTHMNALDQDFYLRISTELYQKRLVGGGFEKVFTVGPNFRNEGISDEHLPEYHQVEWYWAYANYRDNMQLVMELFRYIAQEVYGTQVFTKGEHTFDLASNWQEIDYAQIIKEKLNIDIFTDDEAKMASVLREHHITTEGEWTRNRYIDNLWKLIRKTIAGPAFLINEPKFMSPLSKSVPENPHLTERFHVIIAGSELGNGYSELNDPVDQLERFLDQEKARNSGDLEAQMLDIDYVEMLEYGMPPTSGYGQSERVFWFLEGVTAREGTLFPHLRKVVSDQNKKIYGIHQQIESTAIKKVSTPESMPNGLTEETAMQLLNEHIQNQNLKRHCLAVGFAMRALAVKLGGNEDVWFVLGLLHDADWEETKEAPEEHTKKTLSWLNDLGVKDGPIIHALMSHNRKYTQLAELEGLMEWALETCDELTGFIVAVALTRPDKTLASVEVASIVKKWKTKEFAKAVSREQIEQCEDKLGLALPEFIEIVLNAMKEEHEALGI